MSSFPDDTLEHELTYTQTLIDTLKGQEAFVYIPQIKEELNPLKETLDDISDHYTAFGDKGAHIGHKSEESSFFGYKMRIRMTKERIITATVIASDEKGDGPQLPALTEQNRRDGIDVQTAIGDPAHLGKDNLERTRDEYFKLVAKSNPNIGRSFRKEEDKFDYNEDADMLVCPASHITIRRAKQGRKNGARNQAYTYCSDVHKCQCCLEREGCYKPGAKPKTYPVSIKTDEQQQQIEFQQTGRFKEKVTERYKIEAKDAELKQIYRYDRVQFYGLSCIKVQGAMTIFATNLRRVFELS